VIEYDEIDEILNRLEDTLKALSGAPVTGDVLTFPVTAPEVVTKPPAAAAVAETEVATA
jgi:hypothetical protein